MDIVVLQATELSRAQYGGIDYAVSHAEDRVIKANGWYSLSAPDEES
jgi:hypothetical protein